MLSFWCLVTKTGIIISMTAYFSLFVYLSVTIRTVFLKPHILLIFE